MKKTKLTAKPVFLTIALLWFITGEVLCQHLVNSRKSSYYTYIYKLNNKQARSVYRFGMYVANNAFYSQLIDSFPGDSLYRKKLTVGHYMYVRSIENQLNLELKSENNFTIQLVNNNIDLCIMVLDSAGNLAKKAKLHLNHKKIPFDKKTNTYRLSGTNRDGLLEVELDNQSAFYTIERTNDISSFRRGMNNVLYKSPVKYVYIPVRFVINIPLDLCESILYGHRRGTIYVLTQPVVTVFESIFDWEPKGFVENLFYHFNHKYCSQFKGKIYFSQPKYKPGDTVRLQAFVFDKKNKPLTDSLKVVLYTDRYKELGSCKPIRPGVFVFEFKIKPELEMKLDRSFSISLENPLRHSTVTGNFKYEDYELKSTEFSLRSDKTKYRPDQPVTLYCKGVDENELFIPDARVELTLITTSIDKYKKDRGFVPDTLWHHNQNLDQTGETKIILPDSIFPDVNMNIRVDANFRTSSNEWQSKVISFERKYDPRTLAIKLENDSVKIEYTEKGISVPCWAKLEIDDGDERNIVLPWKEKINPLFKEYDVYKDDLYDGIEIKDESPSVSCLSTRMNDSVVVSLVNPRKLPLVYFVYRKNKLIYRGTEATSSFSCKNTTKGNYFVSLHYFWAGEVKSNEYRIPFLDKELTIKAIEPPVIYPGQKVKISLVVTNSKGMPVENAAMLAYGNTKKFGENNFPGNLPYIGKYFPDRIGYNSFNSNSDFDDMTDAKIPLDWKKWHKRMSLDSIELYKFLYPKKGMYQTCFTAKDSVTQVAPFLISNGALAPVNYVYLDGSPVYFNLTNTRQSYSFQASPGRHTLTLRTYKKIIYYDSLYLQKGNKNIISIDLDSINNKLICYKEKKYYNTYETNEINRYLIRVTGIAYNKSYLNQYGHYELLEPGSHFYNNLDYIAGPFDNDFINFKSYDGHHHSFFHESNYEYEFHDDYYKMKCSRVIVLEKTPTTYNVPDRNFAQLCYTSKNVDENWQQTVQFVQTHTSYFDNPYHTLQSHGSLHLEYIPKTKNNKEDDVKNLILLSYSDSLFSRIYNGSERKIHNLVPGYYKLFAILQDNRYFTEDSIRIFANGENFVRLINNNPLKPDTRIETVNALIAMRIKKSERFTTENKKERQELDQKQIATILQYQSGTACNQGRRICGLVEDNTGSPVPGAMIVVKGTTIGVIADVNGSFCICVPDILYVITITFIGYKPKEIDVSSAKNINIVLEEEVLQLQEVKVIGYGVTKSYDLTSTVTRIQAMDISSELQGRTAGVSISNIWNPGSGNSISIRGIRSVENNTPLFIIDGVPFTGTLLDLNKEDIEQIETLRSAAATALYGSQAANGVVLITTKKGSGRLGINRQINNSSVEGIQQENALRNRFSDLAFWKPAIITDANGIATIEITFPDDITSWNTFYYAYGSKSTGQIFSQIKSFKPLVGMLAVPRFMVKGDITNVIGKAINYTSDTVKIKTSFNAGTSGKSMDHNVITSAIDTFTVTTTGEDTLKITYKLQKDDGYTDGEKRDVPVYPLGTKETVGQFWTLEGDTSFKIDLNKEIGETHLYADAHPLSFALDELEHIRNYGYLCNEQAASKLKALLLEKKIFNILGKEFPHERSILKLIDKLESSRTDYGLWGWWQHSYYSTWISTHVIEALAEARKDGYNVNSDFKELFAKLVYQFGGVGQRDKMRILKVLMSIDSANNYIDYLKKINPVSFDFNERLEYIELQQLNGMKPIKDTLMKWKKETYLGNFYWGTDRMSLFDDAISSTLLVYRIFRKDSFHLDLLPKMRNYVLERRRGMHWSNTYESMKILETILPDIMVNKSVPSAPKLKIEGGTNVDTTGFPVKRSFMPAEQLTVKKNGAFPVYLTLWQKRWNANPEPVDKDFTVKTYFEGKDSVLKAGEAVKLVAVVKVKKSSDYVMIEVPIPAGCSYEEKPDWLPNESHREYFKEKTVIFCDYLGEGTFQFEIKLMPRYTGIYSLNPARAELMYFPLMFGRNEMKRIVIR